MHTSPTPPPAPPPTLVVHGASDLRLAIATAEAVGVRRLTVLSAPAAGCFLGPAWWQALMRRADRMGGASAPALQDVLDCGDQAGRALEALRLGQRTLVLRSGAQWRAVAERAAPLGAVLLAVRPKALDLAAPGADRALAAWLGARADASVADDSAGPPG